MRLAIMNQSRNLLKASIISFQGFSRLGALFFLLRPWLEISRRVISISGVNRIPQHKDYCWH